MLKKLLKKLKRKKKWKLYLYYSGVLIKIIKVKEQEASEIGQNSYAFNVYFKKRLFGSNKAGVIVRPVRLLKTDEKKKKTYWGTMFETGIEI